MEANPKLVIEKDKFHEDLLKVSRDGNISGTICFEFIAWHMLLIRPNEDNTLYTCVVDQNLWVGIPDIRGYVTEFVKTLREYNGITGPFEVKLEPIAILDLPTPLYCKPVQGSEPLQMKHIERQGDHVDIYLNNDVEATQNAAKVINMLNNFTEIEVAGTGYEGRSDRIESVKVGDRLKLVRESDNEFDQNAIDVRNKEGSLGHIPVVVASILAPLLDSGASCDAIVTEVVPLSARSAKAKKAILKICLEYNGASKADSVSKAEQENTTEEDKEKEVKSKAKAKKKAPDKKKKYEAQLIKYRKEFLKWKKKYKATESKRQDFIIAKLEEEKTAIESEAKARRDTAVSKAEADMKKQKDIITAAESALSSLGIFDFGEKMKQKKIIKYAGRKIVDAKSAIVNAEGEYKASMSSAASDARKKEASIRSSVEIEIPLPAEPEMSDFMKEPRSVPGFTMRGMENERLKYEILKVIDDEHRLYTAIEIQKELIPQYPDLSNQKVATILNKMVGEGLLCKSKEYGKTYFQLEQSLW